MNNCPKRPIALGINGVTYKMLRNQDVTKLELLVRLFNRVWQTGVLPPPWLVGLISPILKVGKPPTEPEPCRPVSLTAAAGKEQARLDKKVAFLLLLDMLWAFGPVTHGATLEVLDGMGILGRLGGFFREFLRDRTLRGGGIVGFLSSSARIMAALGGATMSQNGEIADFVSAPP
ncbi:uncharacterized protein LOC144168542 [Haemaphysalis longicornis]